MGRWRKGKEGEGGDKEGEEQGGIQDLVQGGDVLSVHVA